MFVDALDGRNLRIPCVFALFAAFVVLSRSEYGCMARKQKKQKAEHEITFWSSFILRNASFVAALLEMRLSQRN